MSYVPETGTYTPGVYQLETSDPAEGGPGGIANKQATDLASRTKYLKAKTDALDASDLLNGIKFKSTQYISANQTLLDNYVGGLHVVKQDTGTPFTITLPPLVRGDSVNLDGQIIGFVFHGFAFSGSSLNTTWVTIAPAGSDKILNPPTNVNEVYLQERGQVILLKANQFLGEWEIVLNLRQTGQVPIGNIMMGHQAGSPPAGWLMCDGSAVSRTNYFTLFAAIGTQYGAGDGSTTFNLPQINSFACVNGTIQYYIKY